MLAYFRLRNARNQRRNPDVENKVAVGQKTAEDAPEVRESLTDWPQFVKARLVPREIICQEYSPVHPSTVGCHTRLLTKRAKPGAPINPKTKRPTLTGSAESILDHVKAGHGGGFVMKFKKGEQGSEPWAGWAELRSSGIEVSDLRCAWCRKPEDRVHAGSMLEHFKPHKGNGRGLRASDEFFITFSFAKSETEDEEDEG